MEEKIYSSAPQENKIPEPPQMEVDIRTMESDLKAFQEGGGEVPGSGTRRVFTPKAQEISKTEPELNIRGYSGPEKAIFESGNILEEQKAASGSSAKPIIWIIIVIAIIIGLILFGFYVMFPLLFK